MKSSARGVKRPRLTGEPSLDRSHSSGAGAGSGDGAHVKAETELSPSEATVYSRRTPGSNAHTPEQLSAVSPVSHSYPFSVEPLAHGQIPYNISHFASNPPTSGLSPPSTEQLPKSLRSSSPASKAQSNSARSHTVSSFRNVSACNRCRLRKNRCDQRLPACRSCEKAGVKCVGFDPFLGREVPRSYVYHLESRTAYLEKLLQENGIQFLSAENFALNKRPEGDLPPLDDSPQTQHKRQSSAVAGVDGPDTAEQKKEAQQNQESDKRKVDNWVSNIGMVYVQGASDPRYLGSTSGISFARVVFAAVKSTMSRASSDRGARSVKSSAPAVAASGASLRDSAFGLQTKPVYKQAPFPDHELALKLINLYFEYANPQLPILHRGEFMEMFDKVYSIPENKRTPKESYLLKIVFAIGAGIILDSTSKENRNSDNPESTSQETKGSNKKAKLSSQQAQPEEYHASAIVHLESFLGASYAGENADGFGGGLEELQAVLLLAGFALLRPVAPGLWYIVGVAMRLAVDLGLHHEDTDEYANSEAPNIPPEPASHNTTQANPTRKDLGRREWTRDFRRRLWWCVYSVDRLVSTCVGRPFGINDQICTTDFPSNLDDKYITRTGFLEPPGSSPAPSAKLVAHHYFRLRLLHSEIVQVLQFQNAQRAHAAKGTHVNPYMYNTLPLPYLQNFVSFRQWRTDVDRRLWEWKESAPSQPDTGVQFSPLFFDLNYWQTVITLFQPSLLTPPALAHQIPPLDGGIGSPHGLHENEEGDEEFVYLKIAEAGQKVLKLYRQLHRIHLVNYTYLATHHLFMAGISFLYALWHSVAVRSHLTLDDVDFTVLAATSVLSDLIEKCPPAEACKEAFDRMSRMCIQMCMSTTGFGPQAIQSLKKAEKQAGSRRVKMNESLSNPQLQHRSTFSSDEQARKTSSTDTSTRSAPRFDMDLKDLFSEDETTQILQRPSNTGSSWFPHMWQQQQSNIHQVLPETMGYSSMDQTYIAGTPQLSFEMSNQHMNIDPLLQQSSPQSQVSLMNAPTPNNFQQHAQQNMVSYPMMNDFDAMFMDDFQMNNQDVEDGELNLDLLGVGGADGNVDLFNGFFFGSGGAAQNLPAAGFSPA